MKCLLVTLVAFLALLAASQAQSDDGENTTLNSSDSDEVNSSPAPPPPPHPAVPRPRPGYPGFPFGSLFRFGFRLRHPGQQQGQQIQSGDSNDDDIGNPPRLFPPRILVFYDENTNSSDHNKGFSHFNFGTGNVFGNNIKSKPETTTTTTTTAPY